MQISTEQLNRAIVMAKKLNFVLEQRKAEWLGSFPNPNLNEYDFVAPCGPYVARIDVGGIFYGEWASGVSYDERPDMLRTHLQQAARTSLVCQGVSFWDAYLYSAMI